MAEGTTHKRTKAKAAGKSGRTEVPISGNRRLDAVTGAKAIEVETSGQATRLEKAALRLKDSGKKQRILVVPQTHMKKAKDAIRSARTSGTVRNLSGTKYAKVGRTTSRSTKSNNRSSSGRSGSSRRR